MYSNCCLDIKLLGQSQNNSLYNICTTSKSAVASYPGSFPQEFGYEASLLGVREGGWVAFGSERGRLGGVGESGS